MIDFSIPAAVFSVPGSTLFFLAALGIIWWCLNKKAASKIGAAYIISGAVFFIVRFSVQSLRPYELGLVQEPSEFIKWMSKGSSMPSLHLLTVTCLAVGLFLNTRNIILKAASVLAVLVTAASRFYLGMGSLWDIAVGFAIGLTVSVLVNVFVNRTMIDKAHNLTLSLLLLLPHVVLICLAVSMYRYADLSYDNLTAYINSFGVYLGLIISWCAEAAFINFSVKTDRSWKQLVKAVIGCGILLVMGAGFPAALYFIAPSFGYSQAICLFAAVILAFLIFPVFIRKKFQRSYS